MNINVIFYRASIRNISDYSPFGVQLSERTISGDGYRFGFQGVMTKSVVVLILLTSVIECMIRD
ncbi:MAG: hypothetical protein RJA13_1023 [Bacteroidota bacterium]